MYKDTMLVLVVQKMIYIYEKIKNVQSNSDVRKNVLGYSIQ